jgi:DtxR family Mn-dependent transcriptional regulator
VVPDPGRSRLSRSAEDYLKVIYELQSRGGSAQTGAIAEALEIAPPSVSGMVKRLSDIGMLEYEPYRGVHLTRAGRREALRMVRRHRVLETYLTSKLGYGWDSVHEEAERLEHAVSDELVERMAMAVGNPQCDPHGAPIPSKEGEIEESPSVLLSDVPVGETVELRMVDGRNSDLLRFLASLGLRLGTVFEVVARQPFRGPVTVRISGDVQREQVVGHEVAESLGCVLRGHDVG